VTITVVKKPLIKVSSGPRNARTDPESGLRFYTWEGVEYPSVTSIRNLAGMPHGLANWRTNQVINKAMTQYPDLGKMLKDPKNDPKGVAAWLRKAQTEERDKAADLGTKVHDAAAAGVSLADAGADIAPFLKQYLSWVSDSGIEILLRERQIWNLTVGYAGTFDLVGRFPNDSHWMIDLKTGNNTYPEHALQLEAYANGEFIGNDDIVDDAATAILQQVTKRAILHLRPEGWSFKVIPPSSSTWIAFRALLVFARWTHQNPNMDTLISASKTGEAAI
jgi:hypothetical protein